MKKHTKILSVILIIILTLSLFLMPVYAARAPIQYGDIRNDGIDITDATFVQRCVAQLQTYDRYTFLICDVDADNELTVFDATLIQKYVAKEITEFPAGVVDFVDLYIDGLGSNYGSGKAQTGTPVLFKAYAHGFMEPFVYNFYVDGELVKANTTENTFEYTFKTAGVHSVGFDVTNRAGICISEYIDYMVGDKYSPDGSLAIINLYHHKFYGNGGTFGVTAHGGKGEYMFSYALYEDSYPPFDYGKFIIESPYIPYKDNYEFTIDYNFEPGKHYALFVTVKDENGDIVSDILEFDYMLPPPA